MVEAVKVMASAWSIAFIVLFLIVTTAASPSPEFAAARARTTVVLLVGSITGIGWLCYRHREKRKHGSKA